MDSIATTFLPCPQHHHLNLENQRANGGVVFDPSSLQSRTTIPQAFVWPELDQFQGSGELKAPVIDLHGFLIGDETIQTARLVAEACSNHGFFQVTNHGVDTDLIRAAHRHVDAFFKLPLSHKQRVQRKLGEAWGYAGGHADRFASKLPWKETLSFEYCEDRPGVVVDYFTTALGLDFMQTGLVLQEYCEAMKELSLQIMELLALSLGIEHMHFRDFFESSSSIMRCNRYPPCQEPGRTLGTGPHCDPTSLTILHQDQVGGLQVFANDKWCSICPRSDALVINIGDTLMALSNGRYKSCLHRAVVNSERERRTLAFFLCPKEDKVVRAPSDLVGKDGPRMYPDFTWSALLHFTQNHYRADMKTLQAFTDWLLQHQN